MAVAVVVVVEGVGTEGQVVAAVAAVVVSGPPRPPLHLVPSRPLRHQTVASSHQTPRDRRNKSH